MVYNVAQKYIHSKIKDETLMWVGLVPTEFTDIIRSIKLSKNEKL